MWGSSAYDSPSSLATKLGSGHHCLVAFLSPGCGLCATLRPALSKVEAGSEGRLAVARLNATRDIEWAPEMLRYDVEAVPCLVLLRPDGAALCKTGLPSTARQMEGELAQMLEAVRR